MTKKSEVWIIEFWESTIVCYVRIDLVKWKYFDFWRLFVYSIYANRMNLFSEEQNKLQEFDFEVLAGWLLSFWLPYQLFVLHRW